MASKRVKKLDIAPFFHQDKWSDVTVKFGDKEMKCHKLILGSASKYFEKLLEGAVESKESNVKVLELGDDPAAVEATLQYIYTFSYKTPGSIQNDDWKFHLNVAIVAHKYDLKALRIKAFVEFWKLAENLRDIHEIIEILQSLPGLNYPKDVLEEFEQDILGQFFPQLIKEPAFRSALEQDGKRAVRYLEQVGFAFGLREGELEECRDCGFRQVDCNPNVHDGQCQNQHHSGRGSDDEHSNLRKVPFWINWKEL